MIASHPTAGRARPPTLPGRSVLVLAVVLTGLAAKKPALGLAGGEPGHEDSRGLANFDERDFLTKDFQFRGGRSLPESQIHDRTFDRPRRDADGWIAHAVLLLRATTGSGDQWLRSSLADFLYREGQPLDASEFFLVAPNGLESGKSIRPSDGLPAKFPRSGYRDMVGSQHRLVSESLGSV